MIEKSARGKVTSSVQYSENVLSSFMCYIKVSVTIMIMSDHEKTNFFFKYV